jgi:hypothetical protein
VAEGSSVVLGAPDLGFTDPDTLPEDVVFTVSDLVNGRIRVAGAVATSFTGAELRAGEVAFEHDGSETTAASFRIAVEDGDADGSAPQSATFTLTVAPVNEAPVQALPGNTFTGLDVPQVFGAAGGNAISVSDPDGTDRVVQITVWADRGTVTLARTTGLTLDLGTGTNDEVMTFTGTSVDLARLEECPFGVTSPDVIRPVAEALVVEKKEEEPAQAGGHGHSHHGHSH